ncbi:hypothetical protein V9L05_01570 [Bernardetia sp. Wsw4-3y2]|uniref:hypothetical protein n=1 Tax=Bernardetia sp. Wsw4-3y2 TaxID=3127471 RepID=UPI0030CBB060
MQTYNFNQFDASFQAENNEQALQLMNAFSQMLNKNVDNLDGLLTIANHINSESKQFKMIKTLAMKTVKTKK